MPGESVCAPAQSHCSCVSTSDDEVQDNIHEVLECVGVGVGGVGVIVIVISISIDVAVFIAVVLFDTVVADWLTG
jgi:hypothetical protein